MIYVWQLVFWVCQWALLLAMLCHISPAQHSVLWWMGLGGLLVCSVGILWLVPEAYRRLLWRRRKSVRPSREIQTERRRIAAALHDGVGSQLVSAASMVDADTDPLMRSALEQCLLDLRLIVDSMDADGESLAMLLGRYRHRIQPVLDRRGIRLYWNVWDPELLGEQGHLPRGLEAREILAVLQEAVSNVLQHARAQQIWITLTPADNIEPNATALHGRLCIEDDGLGMLFAPGVEIQATPKEGRGLLNMRRRAQAIDARLSIYPREGGGTAVQLVW